MIFSGKLFSTYLMQQPLRHVAVVLAGGVGSRAGFDKPKQFLEVAGRTVLEHSVDAFERNAHIDQIIVVSNPLFVDDVKALAQRNRWTKLVAILEGGKERYDSSLQAIRYCQQSGEDVNLLFHDAVRPLVSQRIINDVCEALRFHCAVNVSVPVTDTIIFQRKGYIAGIPDRSQYHRSQTPQAFRLSIITEAYRRALLDPKFKVTDDCGVVKKYYPDEPIFLVDGDESNMKLTYRNDLFVLERLFALREKE